MSMSTALAWIASGRMKSRAERRTADIINALPEEIQKDIGWRWTPTRREKGNKPGLRFEVL
ncbi:MAG: hypothetical protein KF874_07225 [Rhizobiaceae bacterium]|nr:hypothetical protein [Rhizobiaceae bacterium]